MDKFNKARNQFQEQEGNKFGAVLYSMQNERHLIEWRVRKADGKMSIIQYIAMVGYQIYFAE